MNNQILYALTALLVTRWIFHPRAGRMRWGRTLLKLDVEIIVLLPLFARPGILVAVAGLLVINVTGAVLDRRLENPSTARFITLLMTVVGLLAAFGSPRLALGFNEYALQATEAIARENGLIGELDARVLHNLLVVLAGALLVAVEANHVIRLVLHSFRVGPAATSVGLCPDREQGGRELNRGRIIGILERLIIYALVMLGSIGSVGFVLAAKAFARFRELDNREFAEYVLIGTLLSVGLALAVGLGFRVALQ